MLHVCNTLFVIFDDFKLPYVLTFPISYAFPKKIILFLINIFGVSSPKPYRECVRAALMKRGTVGSNFFLLFFFVLSYLEKKNKNVPIADRHMSMSPRTVQKLYRTYLLQKRKKEWVLWFLWVQHLLKLLNS